MADEEGLAQLTQNVSAWNRWRADNSQSVVDLRGAQLTGTTLIGVNLRKADLRGANLIRADVRNANLTDADLSGARLWEADLTDADLKCASLSRASLNGTRLTRADLSRARLDHALLRATELTGANLYRTHLHGADVYDTDLTSANLYLADLSRTTITKCRLAGANLRAARLDATVFMDVEDLHKADALEQIRHDGPSTLDPLTLSKSNPLPLGFLRGCGVPERWIAYLPSLRSGSPIHFYSCFISYSTANQDFADRLYADLQSRGVRCWFAPHDMKPGRKIHEQVDEAIRVYDRLLLILSKESMSSRWVKTEIARARRKEVISNRQVLCPVALVPYTDVQTWEQFNVDLGEDTASEVREYFIPDFSDWKVNHDSYQRAFEKVVAALGSGATGTGG
jgi:hypothetical protein